MPPQPTNISPGIEGDAARLGLNVSIGQAKDAIDQVLAARLQASAKALDGDAAGATAASTPSVLGLLKRAWLAFLERRQNRKLSLHDLSDRELKDIGLTRGEIDHLSPQRAIDTLRDGAIHIWSRHGM